MYERILLPTDGSPGMMNAIENAMYQAQASGATVYALYVVDLRAYAMLPEETQTRVVDVLESEGREALETVERIADEAGVAVETELMRGVPHDVILGVIDDRDVDLVVMGTHGRTGEEKRVLGSIAEEVVRNATVPVMTVRMSEQEIEALDPDVPPEEQLRYIR